ncbi:MAG: hypothetical protein QM817_35025 [Archangium sp.]
MTRLLGLLWCVAGVSAWAQVTVTGGSSTSWPLYVDTNRLWKTKNIAVCWESSDNATERGWVQSAVTNSWQARSGLTFSGWGTCPASGFRGIRIQVADAWPHTEGLGTDLDGKKNGMVLNFVFTFTKDGKQPFSGCLGGSRQFCIEAIGVHEFGHALGFAHEQNRPDVINQWCAGEGNAPGAADGVVMVGPWDLDSVMNYCNPSFNGGGRLSATDVEGVQRYYGAPANDSCNFRTGPFEWNCAGRVAGATSCVQIAESADPHTWNDNFLCMYRSGGPIGTWSDPTACAIQWSSAGPIAGKRCTQISEPADPHTWNDNYLCVANTCPYYFTWSYAGRLANQQCVPWREPADPYTWNDNYLCFDGRPPEQQPQVFLNREENFIAGPFGHKENKVIGGACPAGTVRDTCIALTVGDSGGWCSAEGNAPNGGGQSEAMGFVSGDASDCRCRFHMGAPALQRMHCRVQISNVCAAGHTRCGDQCCNGSQTCQAGQCVDPAPPPGPDCERRAGIGTWSCYRPVPGKTCVKIDEGADPDTWNDNYFCTDVNIGARWSMAGPIAGMRCTQINEGAEPADHTWNDNYLCVPPLSPWQLRWSMAGPIAGYQCVQWLEPSDPHTWNDNYLCMKR